LSRDGRPEAHAVPAVCAEENPFTQKQTNRLNQHLSVASISTQKLAMSVNLSSAYSFDE